MPDGLPLLLLARAAVGATLPARRYGHYNRLRRHPALAFPALRFWRRRDRVYQRTVKRERILLVGVPSAYLIFN